MITLNSKSKKLLLLQRNNLFSSRQVWLRKKFGRFIFTNFLIYFFQKKNLEEITENLFKEELDIIKNYLPNNPNNIMDIGCGLGIINIFLNQFYKNKPHFYLLDKNRIDTKIKYGFNKNYESYNDLFETKNLLTNNSIDEERLHIFDVEKEIKIKNEIDLVISLKSMGYHYPIENYLSLFKNCCTKETVFIFDMSEGYYNESLINDYFKKIKVIYREKNIHSLVRLYCKNLIINF